MGRPGRIKSAREKLRASEYQKERVKRLREQGRCMWCGKPRENSSSVRLCQECADKQRVYKREEQRRRKGSRPWESGKPGRPPLSSYKENV